MMDTTGKISLIVLAPQDLHPGIVADISIQTYSRKKPVPSWCSCRRLERSSLLKRGISSARAASRYLSSTIDFVFLRTN
jgi:hypothetical protein